MRRIAKESLSNCGLERMWSRSRYLSGSIVWMLLLLLSGGWGGCRDVPVQPSPPPCEWGYNGIRPILTPSGHIVVGASPDGAMVAYTSIRGNSPLRIVNVETYVVYEFDVQLYLPEGKLFTELHDILWCPYDRNRLVVLAGSVDQKGMRRGYAFAIALSGGTAVRVEKVIPESPEDRIFLHWMAISSPGADYFVLSGERMYWLQQDTILPLPEKYRGEPQRRVWSPGDQHWFGIVEDENGQRRFLLDGVEIRLPRGADRASWAPNGRSLMVSRLSTARGIEIAIIRGINQVLDNPSTEVKPDYVIDPSEQWCMYSMDPVPRFVSDTTFAVSLFPPGFFTSYIYEVSVEGRILRQLTFEL